MRLATALLLTISAFASATSEEAKLYEVKDGNKVDAKTLMGWKTWRALACERCHGAAQEGLVGPPLVERMKILADRAAVIKPHAARNSEPVRHGDGVIDKHSRRDEHPAGS